MEAMVISRKVVASMYHDKVEALSAAVAATECLDAPAAGGMPIVSDALEVWRMGRGIRREHHLPQLSPDVRAKSCVVAARCTSHPDMNV